MQVIPHRVIDSDYPTTGVTGSALLLGGSPPPPVDHSAALPDEMCGEVSSWTTQSAAALPGFLFLVRIDSQCL